MDKIEVLHDLCGVIARELEEVNDKIERSGGSMSAGDLEVVDKLTHAMKSIKTTIAMMEAEDGYSERYTPMYYDGGHSYRRGTYARRRRDSMGRYSRAEGEMSELIEEMRGMMPGLSEDKRREVERFIDKMER